MSWCRTFAPDWPPCPQPPAWGNPFRTAWTTCSGVRAQIALKVYGDDLDTLRGLAGDLRDRLSRIPGITDLQIEKQVLIPQIKIHLDYEQAARYGVAPGAVLRSLQQMIEGERITQIVEGNRRFDLVVRLPEDDRGLHALKGLLIETPQGRCPCPCWQQ